MPLHPEAVPEFCFIVPCSPISAKAVPAGDGWVHEVKFDGYRVQIHKVGSRIVLFSHNGHRLALLRVAEQWGLEGVVSKRRDAPYRSGECRDWRKVKTATWREANRERWRLFE